MLRSWKGMLADRLNPGMDTPLYMQIIHALIHEIQRGQLSPGCYLPSSRALAAAIGVNRKTIVYAYEDLIAQGWLSSSGTRGTIVASTLPDTTANRMARSATEAGARRLVEAAYPYTAATDSFTRAVGAPRPEGVAGTGDSNEIITLDEGAPDCRLLSADSLMRAHRTAVQRATHERRFKQADPRGSEQLRSAIATMLKAQRGMAVTADNICITRGGRMGNHLAAKVLVRPGDTVLVEALTRPWVLGLLQSCGARIVPIRLDRQGLDVDEIEQVCGRDSVRAVFLTPHHQFPTTVALAPERRLRLLDLARQYHFAVVEEDYDHEFHFESQSLLPMASYAPDGVMYVGSLSKLLLPALRVGYIAAPSNVIESLARQIVLLDGIGNTLTEDAVAELMQTGEVRRHVRKVTQIYEQRRRAFAETLTEQLGQWVDFDLPMGGLAFWLRFRELAVLDRLEAEAPGLGALLTPSRAYMGSPTAERGLRLGFASRSEEESRESIGRLRQVLMPGAGVK